MILSRISSTRGNIIPYCKLLVVSLDGFVIILTHYMGG